MLDWTLLQSILIVATACSSITVIFIQKTKRFMPNSKMVPVYSLFVNIVLGFVFTQSFTDISYINSVWAGLFSFLGADTIYKSLEDSLSSYNDIIQNQVDKNNQSEDIISEIEYE